MWACSQEEEKGKNRKRKERKKKERRENSLRDRGISLSLHLMYGCFPASPTLPTKKRGDSATLWHPLYFVGKVGDAFSNAHEASPSSSSSSSSVSILAQGVAWGLDWESCHYRANERTRECDHGVKKRKKERKEKEKRKKKKERREMMNTNAVFLSLFI